MTDRPLPVDLNAERATLGSILLERDAIIAVAPWLRADMFYMEKHAWIYDACLAAYHRRVPPDTMTVSDELRRVERLDPVGGITYLMELSNDVPTAVHVEHYARIVERTATLRRLIETGGKIIALGYDQSDDVEQTLERAERELYQVVQRRITQDYRHIGACADSLYEWLADDRRQGPGLPTGYPDLDRILTGLHRSDLLLLAARPGMGKTSLALSIGRNVAQAGGTVGIVSLEMGQQQLMQRLVCMETGLELQRLRAGQLSGDERARAVDALGELSQRRIYIDDQAGQSAADIRAKARRLASVEPLDLLIVDYLQLAESHESSRRHNRTQQVDEISRTLKSVARELDCPLLALSQLSRAVEQRTDRRPQLSDLRESGQLEADADVVLFLYRDEVYNRESDRRGVAEVQIAKHRNGPTGMVGLRLHGPTTRFQSLAGGIV